MQWAEPCARGFVQGENMTENAGPAKVEQAIGARLKLLRNTRKMSQKELAELLDVKFQQVQKYENGTNRISASRLNKLMLSLNVGWDFFFPAPTRSAYSGQSPFGMAESDQQSLGTPEADQGAANDVLRFLETNDGIRLNVAFSQIKDQEQRKSIIKMAETLAKTS